MNNILPTYSIFLPILYNRSFDLFNYFLLVRQHTQYFVKNPICHSQHAKPKFFAYETAHFH